MRQNFQGALSPVPPVVYSAPAVRQDRAAYRILTPCFLEDTMYFEGQMVYWDEEPNSEMEPLNDLARKASKKFFDERDELGKLASASKNRLYVNLQRPFTDDPEKNTLQNRRPELKRGDGGVPVMGARKRGRPKVERINTDAPPEAPVMDASAKPVKDDE